MTAVDTRKASVAQFNIIRSLSRQIFGVHNEWTVLDQWQTEEILTFGLAGRLIEQLHVVKGLVGTRDAKKAALADLMAGRPLPDEAVFVAETPALVEPDPPRYTADVVSDGAEVGTAQSDIQSDIPAETFTPDVTSPETEPEEEEEPTEAPQRKQRTLMPIAHGTRKGFQAHKRRGIPLCEPCRQANSEYQKSLKLRGKVDPFDTDLPVTKSSKPLAKRTLAPEPDRAEAACGHFREALLVLLPNTGELFPRRTREIWLQIATLIAELWPDEPEEPADDL